MATHQIFKALADPTRREILKLLRSGEMTAGELAERFDMTKPTMSHHFSLLKDADLISSRREGPTIMTGMMLLFAALPALSPRHFEIGPFLLTYLYIMIVIIASMAYFQAVVLWAAFSSTLQISRAISGGICVLWILMANVMGKVKRNFFDVCRTPRRLWLIWPPAILTR